jgi:hypothetical protein
MVDVRISITGAENLQASLKKLPIGIRSTFPTAHKKFGEEIINQIGVKVYPPTGPGNYPPVPYYIRGKGTQYATHNAGNSEQYGKRWTSQINWQRGIFSNSASYARFLGGSPNAYRMRAIGWKSLLDAAKGKMQRAGEIYGKAVVDALIKVGLK